MTWKIEFAPGAQKELDKLDRQITQRILRFLQKRVSPLKDPRSIGNILKGPKFGEFWRYRVGDYRIVVRIEDDVLLVLVLRIGHRKHVYKKQP
jgi:mRNA interferase RelE/StbE